MCPPANNAQEEGTAPPPAPRSDLRDFLGGLLLVVVSAVFAVAISGSQADELVERLARKEAWIMFEAGQAVKNPADLKIQKP